MHTIRQVLFIVLFVALGNSLYSQELRGSWLARNNISTKELLAAAIDSLAKNNFNVVYVNAWSRGYPLWQSDVFFRETGVTIDPLFAGRDVLAEAIAEAHKHGMLVEAWFEYGFVGGWTGNMPAGVKGPIFQAHPDWVAQKLDGSEIDGSNFYWMVHTRPDVQNFLIGMVTEVCRKYDIDAIELDRIRYSSTSYGYDPYTDSLYRAENGGQAPPTDPNNATWKRYRADKLNAFMARAYDSVKSVSPHIKVTNAPSLYSSTSYTAYDSFCQDWVWWVNNGKVDNVQVQSYVGSASSFGAILDYMINSLINDRTKVVPALAINPGGSTLANDVLRDMVNLTRTKGFKGTAVWYYSDLLGVFPYFKANIFTSKNYSPSHPSDWRNYSSVIAVSDTAQQVRNGNWTPSTLPGYNNGASLSTSGNTQDNIVYSFQVPKTGVYEVYAYMVTGSNRADSAQYTLRPATGSEKTVYVNQTNSSNRRWIKLGDIQLNEGRQTVLTLSAAKLKTGQVLSADAVMITLNRKLSPLVSGIEEKEKTGGEEKSKGMLSVYPNPAQDEITVCFGKGLGTEGRIEIYNTTGRTTLSRDVAIDSSTRTLSLGLKGYASGIYFINFRNHYASESIAFAITK